MKTDVRLDQLRCGESATVRALGCSGAIRRRLGDIGLIPGARVRCIGRSPFGDPSAYEICGAVIAIRAADAREIRIDLTEWEANSDGLDKHIHGNGRDQSLP